MSRKVTVEQGRQLAARLREAGVAHGDVARDVVLVGVGVDQGAVALHLAFCPADLARIGSIQCASAAERQLPLPTDVKLGRNAAKRIRQITGNRRGFATLHCGRVWANGVLNVQEVTVVSFTPVDEDTAINFRNSYQSHLTAANA